MMNLKKLIQEEVKKLQRITVLEEEKKNIKKELSILNERFGPLLNKKFNKGEVINTDNPALNDYLEKLRNDLIPFELYVSSLHADSEENHNSFIVYIKDFDSTFGKDFYAKYSLANRELMNVLLKYGGKHVAFENGVIVMNINI